MPWQRFGLLVVALISTALAAGRAGGHPGSGIVVDRDTVYFADTGKGVWRIDAGGKLTLVSSSAMHWMTIDRTGGFADAPESIGEWFGRLSPRGERPVLISCSDFPCVVGTDGNLYYAKMHGLTVVRRTPAGRESVLASPEKFGPDVGRHAGVNGIACGPDGTVYLVSLDSLNKTEGTGEHVLFAVGPDGSVRAAAKNFVTAPLPEAERHPEVRSQYSRGLAVDATGNVYVAVTGNRCVMKISPAGAVSTVLTSQKPWSPTGVDVSEDGVYVLEYDDETPTEGRNWPPRVRKVGPDGKVSVLATVTRNVAKSADAPASGAANRGSRRILAPSR